MSYNFTICGQEIEISEDQASYNNIRLNYEKMAVECANKYFNSYYDKYNDIKVFSEKGFQDGYKVINEALQKTIQILVDNSIYNIDEEVFLNEYDNCLNDWYNSFEEINDKYMEIILDAQQIDEYRTARRKSRAKLIGGGFGLSGAAKGIAQAGAINLVSGAAHGAANLVGKGITGISNSIKKSNLYKSDDTKNTLWSGIYLSVFQLHFALCDILNISKLENSDIEKAKSIFNNLDKMSSENKIDNLTKIIKMFPYKADFYYYCIENFGDSNKQVEKMANFFGLDISEYKTKLLEKKCQELSSNTEKETLESKSVMEENMSLYGIESSPLFDEVNHKLEIFDKEARTVDNISFDTREEAELAKKDLKHIKDILKGYEYKEFEEEAIQCLSDLKKNKFETKLGHIYIEKLEKTVADYDKKERTVNDTIYDTREEAKKVRQEIMNRTVSGVVLDDADTAKEIEKILPLIKDVLAKEKNNIKKVYTILKKVKGKDINTEALKSYLFKMLNDKEKKEVYNKAKTHRKRKDRGIFISLFMWGLGIFTSFIIIGLLNVIGLGIVFFTYLGYFLNRKEEKIFWTFLTNDGRIQLNEEIDVDNITENKKQETLNSKE